MESNKRVSQKTISKKYDGEKIKRREQYLQKLIDQNVAQTTGHLDRKGFPASLFEDDNQSLPNLNGVTRLPMIHKDSKDGALGWPGVNKFPYESVFGAGSNQFSDQRRQTYQGLAPQDLFSENFQGQNFHQINLNLQVAQGQPEVTSGKSNGRYRKKGSSQHQNLMSIDSRGQKNQLLDLKQRLASETTPNAAVGSKGQQVDYSQLANTHSKQGPVLSPHMAGPSFNQEQNNLMTEPAGISPSQMNAYAIKQFANNSDLQVKPSLAQWAHSQAKSGSLSPKNADLAKVNLQIGTPQDPEEIGPGKGQHNVNLQISRTISNTFPSKENLDTRPPQTIGVQEPMQGHSINQVYPQQQMQVSPRQFNKQSPQSLQKASQSPKQFKAALQAHRDERELLGLPTRLETTNLQKFERQIGPIMANQKGKGIKKRNARYNQSIDFMSSKNKLSILQEKPNDNQKWSVDDDDSFGHHMVLQSTFDQNPVLDSRHLRASFDDSTNRITLASRALLTGKHQQQPPSIMYGNKLLNSQSIRQSARASIELDQKRSQLGYEFEEKFEIVAEDPNTLMSHRERNFQHNKAMINSTLKSGLTRNHKQPQKNFMLQSNHYKYNRLKEGGWGNISSQAPKDIGISTAPHSVGRDTFLPNIGSQSKVYAGLLFDGNRSIQIENPLDSLDHSAFLQAHHSVSKMLQGSPVKAIFSREEQEEFEKQKQGKKVIRASLVETQPTKAKESEQASPNKAIQNAEYIEYNATPLDNEVKQMVIMAIPPSNRSHILSSKTDRTQDYPVNTSKVLSNDQTRHASKLQTYNKNDTQLTTVVSPHRDSKISDPDMIQNGMLNLTMNLEHSKNSIQHDSKRVGLIEALAKGGSEQKQDLAQLDASLFLETQKLASHASQMINPTKGSVQNLSALLKTHGSQSAVGGSNRKHRRQHTKNSIHASIDSLKLNWMKEKEERKLFNEQFAQMNSSYGPQADQKIEEKAFARRQRNQIQQQMKEIQAQIKEKKRLIEAQRVKNKEIADQQEQSVDLYKRLCNILNMHSAATNTENTPLLDPIHGSSASLNLTQSSTQLFGSPSKAAESGQDIHGFYKFLFESDLKTARDRTVTQLESVQSQADFNLREIEILNLEQQFMRASIKRYQQMIKDITDGKTKPARKPGERSILGEKGAQSSFVQQQLNKQEKTPDIESIDQAVYKYGDNKKPKNEETKSSFFGNMTANTPGLGGHFNKGATHMSFAARAPLIFDIKKAEIISHRLAPVFRQTKALDAIILQLAMMKEVFKAQKLTLFVIDPDLQTSLFSNKNERKQNYKKIMLGGQNIIYGLFNNESDFSGPIFKDVDGAGHHMFNNKVIIIPLKEKKKTLMSLQVVYDPKMKVGRAAALNASMDASSRKGGVTNKKDARGMSRLSVASKSPSRRSKAGGAEVFSGATSQRSGRGHHGPIIPGWNQNDNNLLRILAGFLKLNVECYNFQVQMKQKEKKIYEIIAFAQDIMQIKTYRQLVNKIKDYCTPLMGFDSCTVFFEHTQSKELFTVADLGSQVNPDPQAVDFAKELYFPDDQVVVFPATIGITGEIHQKLGNRYENNFGQLIKSKGAEIEDQSDAQSFQTGLGYSRRSSLRNLLSQPLRTPRHGGAEGGGKLKTRLEQIKEDAPNEDALGVEIGLSLQKRRSMHPSEGRFHNHSSLNIINQSELQSPLKPPIVGSVDADSNFSGLPGNLETLGKDSGPSRNQQEARSPYPTQGDQIQNEGFGSFINNIDVGKLDVLPHATPGKKPKDIKDLLQVSNTPAPEYQGNILDLTSDTARRGQGLVNLGTLRRSKSKKDAKDAGQRWFAEFTPDIDNFAGIKNLNNWMISSLNDDAYGFGDVSVGVIQLYNKSGGKSINKEDVARFDKISKFIGALSQKALHQCSALSLVIGLNQNAGEIGVIAKGIDTTPGTGTFAEQFVHVDIMDKQIKSEKIQEDLLVDNSKK